ncbi:MAG: TetR/AcrR family transcriptional regulator [Candidatus Binatia bacterium]
MHAQSKSAEKRTVILQAAAELFAEKDFHLVLMDEVAARAKVGKGTLYRYFPTKEDLYFATIFDGWDRLREELEEVLQEEGLLKDTLEKATRQILSYFWQRRQFVTLVHRLEHTPNGEEQAEWRSRREGIVRLVEGVLKRRLGSNALSAGQCRLITEMFLGMLRSIILHRGSRDTPATLARMVVRLFLDGFRTSVEPQDTHTSRTGAGGKSDGRAVTLL